MNALESVRRIASDLFQLAPDQVRPDSSPETIANWDSVQHMNLILALESEFDVQFEPEEFEQMNTISGIAALLESKPGWQAR
ncbi:MAG: acyl carrier protein [Bryobacteraceae bacterium]